MTGTKKLSQIRDELRLSVADSGDDPIRWLDERVTINASHGTASSGENEVLSSLQRILEVPVPKKGQRRKSRGRKSYT
jgi:hypothetical protein